MNQTNVKNKDMKENMKEIFNKLLYEYQKTLSDSSSKALKVVKLKDFESTVAVLRKENPAQLHNFLLGLSDTPESKIVSNVLWKVIFNDELNQSLNQVKQESFEQNPPGIHFTGQDSLNIKEDIPE